MQIKKKKGLTPLQSCLVVAFGAFATSSFASNEEASISPYIVNGSNASINTFPATASLFVDSFEYDGVHFSSPYCGATILDKSHILTAAHCIYGDQVAQLFTVVVPQLQNESSYPDGNITRHRVSEVYYPSNYINDINRLIPNDIAILKLETEMNIGDADFVKLPDSESYRINSSLGFVAVGHGDTQSGVDSTDELQRVDLDLVTTANCKNAFIDGSYLTDKQICFTGPTISNSLRGGTCQGDSGGPVYWNNATQFEQIGVTSFGPSTCGDKDASVTSVFTEIRDYQGWIDSVRAGNEIPKATSSDAMRSSYLSSNGSLNSSSNGGSGGSASWFSLLALAAFGFARRFSKTA